MRKILTTFILLAFLANTFVPPSYAQALLPKAGEMVSLSPAFQPPMLSGVKVYVNDPFRLDFILNKGEGVSASLDVTEISSRLIKYFLASLTIPEKDLWVNLSPYEKDRIIPDEFGLTEMGRDLLAQDYILKQITSSLMYPETGLGKEFWAQVYAQAHDKYGATDIPLDTFNKVWITPSKAVVYEKIDGDSGAVAYVLKAPLKVMLEADYLAAKNNTASEQIQDDQITRNVIREIILPALEKEVNEGKNFTQLRQVYHSFILAAWYKKKVKESLLAQAYVDQSKVQGVNIDDPKEAEKIWGQYVEAFKKGVFNFVKEERDTFSQELIPRKYFAGGVIIKDDSEIVHELKDPVDHAGISGQDKSIIKVRVDTVRSDWFLSEGKVNTVYYLSRWIDRLTTPAFKGKSAADMLQWALDVFDWDGVQDKNSLDAFMRRSGLENSGVREETMSALALAAKDLVGSVSDKKINIYLPDALSLFLAEKELGGRPYMAHLSLGALRAVAGVSVDKILEAMVNVTGGRPDAFFQLYKELLSDKHIADIASQIPEASRETLNFLNIHRANLRIASKTVEDHIPLLGVRDHNIGVRYIGQGDLPMFFEAVSRYHFGETYKEKFEAFPSRLLPADMDELSFPFGLVEGFDGKGIPVPNVEIGALTPFIQDLFLFRAALRVDKAQTILRTKDGKDFDDLLSGLLQGQDDVRSWDLQKEYGVYAKKLQGLSEQELMTEYKNFLRNGSDWLLENQYRLEEGEGLLDLFARHADVYDHLQQMASKSGMYVNFFARIEGLSTFDVEDRMGRLAVFLRQVAINGSADPSKYDNAAKQSEVKTTTEGGIDLGSDQLDLQTTGNGSVKFKVDPAELQRLRGAAGFVPTILDVQPMNDLPQFLGLTAAQR